MYVNLTSVFNVNKGLKRGINRVLKKESVPMIYVKINQNMHEEEQVKKRVKKQVKEN